MGYISARYIIGKIMKPQGEKQNVNHAKVHVTKGISGKLLCNLNALEEEKTATTSLEVRDSNCPCSYSVCKSRRKDSKDTVLALALVMFGL